jgi:hypothetical protein
MQANRKLKIKIGRPYRMPVKQLEKLLERVGQDCRKARAAAAAAGRTR